MDGLSPDAERDGLRKDAKILGDFGVAARAALIRANARLSGIMNDVYCDGIDHAAEDEDVQAIRNALKMTDCPAPIGPIPTSRPKYER